MPIDITLTGDTGRRCGDCTLCCKLLPVNELGKGAGERCRHQRSGKGCAVYRKPGFPRACAFWNCRWLVGQAGETRRPDRAHYVIDVMPDYVVAHDKSGETINFAVVQIWIDPGYRDAHRDPALRRWLDETEQMALVRFSSSEAMLLVPPSRTHDCRWVERTTMTSEKTHSLAEIEAALA